MRKILFMFALFTTVQVFSIPLNFLFEDTSLSQENKTSITNDLALLYRVTFLQETPIEFYPPDSTTSRFVGVVSAAKSSLWPEKWNRMRKITRDESGTLALWVSQDDSTWYTNHFAVLDTYPSLYSNLCAFVDDLDTKARAGTLTNEEAFNLSPPSSSVAFSSVIPYSSQLQQMISELTLFLPAKALVQIYPAQDHPTGVVLADGIRFTNKPGEQTPNFISLMPHCYTGTTRYFGWPLIYYQGKWRLFMPENIEDVVEEP